MVTVGGEPLIGLVKRLELETSAVQVEREVRVLCTVREYFAVRACTAPFVEILKINGEAVDTMMTTDNVTRRWRESFIDGSEGADRREPAGGQ